MKLWIDTDAGVDDSTAILIALAAPDVEVIGISCVGGNAHLVNVVNNVRRTIQVFYSGIPRDKWPKNPIPIYSGCQRALVHPSMVIPEIHGKDGLGDISNADFDLLDDAKSENSDVYAIIEGKHAVNELINAIRENKGVTLLTLGPLTNIAIALRLDESSFLQNVDKIYVMGGAEDGIGNTSPYAEFNIRCDPEAAQILFQTFPQNRTYLASWTLTQKYSFKTKEDLEKFQNKRDTKLGRWVANTWKCIVDFTKGDMLMADPLASFVCCYPQYVTKIENLTLNVVLSDEKVGMTEAVPNEDGTRVVKEINFDKYKEVFLNLMNLH